MTDSTAKSWTSVCGLTNSAMEALAEVEQALMGAGRDSLGPLEFRTLMWSRCALASLYGIRADETLAGADFPGDVWDVLDGNWCERLLGER